MRHPDLQQVPRYLMLDPTSPRPRALFRSNHLNPRARWGKPVPVFKGKGPEGDPDPMLIYDNCVVPLRLYYPCLQGTAHIPADAIPFDINYFPDPTTANNVQALESLRSKEYHDGLTSIRDHTVCELVHKFLDTLGYDDPMKSIKACADRMGLGTALVQNILHKRENFTFDVPSKARARATRAGLSTAFSRTSTYRSMYKLLLRAVQSVRCHNSQVAKRKGRPPTGFALDALAVPDAPGGFPTHCPVTGMELNWEIADSVWSARVGRRDSENWREEYTTQGVVLMSKLAKRVLEGNGDPKLLAKYITAQTAPGVIKGLRAWVGDKRSAHVERFIYALGQQGKLTLIVASDEPPPTVPTSPTNPLPIYTPHPLPVTPTLINSGENLAVKYLT